jgi:hypothetical protein
MFVVWLALRIWPGTRGGVDGKMGLRLFARQSMGFWGGT